MSSAQIAAKATRSLEIEDWTVLRAIEKSIPSYESVPLKRIEKLTLMHPDQVRFRLDRLNSFGFVMRTPFGFILNTAGLDAIALNNLVKRNVLSAMGKSIGMGKESDVFEVISDSGERLVIKFYRIGRVSFRSTRKKRSYISSETQHQWLTVNIHAAVKEEEGLKLAEDVGINSPKFHAREKHAVVMSLIEGLMLYKCTKDEVEYPEKLLKQILDNERTAYTKARIINGDLSEYNILFDGEKPWIIDWPQFVYSDHPNAVELLKRDVENSISFVRRKFGVEIDDEKALSYVSGKSESLKF